MSFIPRPEHPMPDFERKVWQNLNGKWQFGIDNLKTGLERGLKSGVDLPLEITVPFCPESKLSGIANTEFMEAVWYQRFFKIDDALKGSRIILHFGAVDYEARVWVNGKEVARHKGGFTPFSADITDAVDINGENELVVYAIDDLRATHQPGGKQCHSLYSKGCMYTRTTGIWQTVWLEAVPKTHISGLAVWPDALNGKVTLEVAVKNFTSKTVVEAVAIANGCIFDEGKSEAAGNTVLTLYIPAPVLWQPGDPFLYDLRLRLVEDGEVLDEVSSYFGLRDVCVEGDRILINKAPVFQRLILDQGFWPDGIYTAPSDDELKADIERSMAMGFNGARLHQKVFEPRTLYWADKLGYLLWGEFPDWGCHLRWHAEGRENFQREWIDVLFRDRNHPAIVAWVPFNEAHSTTERYDPAFISVIAETTRRLDPSRPVIDTSGYTHVKTDIWDLHDYEQDPKVFAEHYAAFAENPSNDTLLRNDADHEPPYTGQPVIVSEYGGTWWNPAQAGEDAWGYGNRPKSVEECIERIIALTDVLLSNPHMAGLCYTQLTDVEQEVNGLYTPDRKPKFPPELIKKALDKKAAIEE